MILSWMVYGGAVALLFGVAAAALEPVVRQRGWPVRGLWAGAMLASVAIPGLALSLTRDPEPVAAAALELSLAAGEAGWLDPLAAVPPGPVALDPWLGRLWAGASAAVLASLLLSYAALRRRGRGWRPRLVDGQEVWISADTGPAVVGFVDSRIVLPEWILERDAEDRALVLAHEGEHLRAGDPRLIFGALLAVAALPWNLPLWWQWRRLRHAVEVDCDLRVLGRGLDVRAYSRLLLDVSERGSARRLAVAALSESNSLLERRIRLMFTPTPRAWLLRALGATALAVVCILVACRADLPSSPAAGTDPALGEVVVPAQQPEMSFAYELSVLERRPELVNRGEIAGTMERLYPRLLQDAGIGGTVVVQLVIAADGSVDPASLKVLEARPELAEATLAAVKTFRFLPGVYQGKEVRTLIQMPVSWQPRSAAAAARAPETAGVPAGQRVMLAGSGPDASAEARSRPRAEGPVQDRVYELSELSRMPELSNRSEIASVMERLYPRLLHDAGIGGTVVMQFVVGADGAPVRESIRVLETDHPQLGEATRATLLHFRFRPGQYRDTNVAVRIQMPVTWQPAG